MNRQAEAFMAHERARPAAGVAHPHESAHLHVAGEALYVDDIPEIAGTLHAALGLSEKAHAGSVRSTSPPVRAAPGVVAVLTAADIPGENDCGPIVHDDPILADGLVQYVGQPMFVVVADTYDAARRAARLAKVDYDVLPAVLTPQEAKRLQSYVLPPMHLQARRSGGGDGRRAAPDRAASSTSAGRSSSISRARSPTRCRRKTAASTSTARRSTRPRCSTSSRTRWISSRTR